jgi:hypothetical protein
MNGRLLRAAVGSTEVAKLRRSGGPQQIVETRFTTSVDGTEGLGARYVNQ